MKLFIMLLSMFLVSSAFADGAADLANEKKLSSEYLDQMSKEPGAQVLDSGVILRPIYVSTSAVYPNVTDTVQVSYHLVDREGRVLDESITADELAVFPLAKLIKCWQIAVPKISVGSFYKVTCPSDVAYGDKGAGDGLIKPGAALTFRLTVFGIQN